MKARTNIAAALVGTILAVVSITAGSRLLHHASAIALTSSSGSVIPWIDAPAHRSATAASPVLPAVSGASGCSAEGLTVALGPEGVWQGSATQNVTITNSGAAPCSLPPALTFRGTGSNGASGVFVSAQPIDTTLAPGETVQLLLTAALACPGAGASTDPTLTTFIATFGDGNQVRLTGGSLDIACGSLGLLAISPVQGVPLPTPGPRAQALLARIVTNRPVLTAGANESFIVRLANRSGASYRFTSCPVYTVTVNASGRTLTRSYLLNCKPVRAIAANATVDFEMRLTMPKGLRQGVAKLVWNLDGGVVTAVVVTVREVAK